MDLRSDDNSLFVLISEVNCIFVNKNVFSFGCYFYLLLLFLSDVKLTRLCCPLLELLHTCD